MLKRKTACIGLIALSILLLLPSCQGIEQYDFPAFDTDGDGWSDVQEETAGTDPSKVDTDDDGYWDPHDPNPLDTGIPGTGSPDSVLPAPAPAPVTPEPGPTEAPARSANETATTILAPEQEALKELHKVQDAVWFMMRNNNLNNIPNPVGGPTSDMHRFPDVTTKHGKAGVGYVLFLHDFNGDGNPDINYIRGRMTQGTYVCDDRGYVSQIITGYE